MISLDFVSLRFDSLKQSDFIFLGETREQFVVVGRITTKKEFFDWNVEYYVDRERSTNKFWYWRVPRCSLKIFPRRTRPIFERVNNNHKFFLQVRNFSFSKTETVASKNISKIPLKVEPVRPKRAPIKKEDSDLESLNAALSGLKIEAALDPGFNSCLIFL